MSSGKICVTYGLCQLEAIVKILKNVPEFTSVYTNIYYRNSYTLKIPLEKEFLDLLPVADLFIYQPISQKYNNFSTNHLKSLLSAKCKVIGFPYLFNNGVSALCYTAGYEEKIAGYEDIVKYFENGKTLQEVLDMLKNEEIEFTCKNRFLECINHMRNVEETIELPLSSYILNNIQYQRIFRSISHPYNKVLFDITYFILQMIHINTDNFPKIDNKLLTEANHVKLVVSPYEKKYYKLYYEIDEDWYYIYSQFVDLIYKKWKNNTLIACPKYDNNIFTS